MFNVFVTNLGKYNEGELVGKWLELPATEDEIDEIMEEIGIDGEEYEEYFITDYECDLGIEINEYSNLYSLNDMAEEIANMDEYDSRIVNTLMSEGGYSLEEAMRQKDDCRVYFNCYDMEDVAREYAEEVGLLDSIPENLRYYFDFEAFGRDMGYEGNFYFGEDFCVEAF